MMNYGMDFQGGDTGGGGGGYTNNDNSFGGGGGTQDSGDKKSRRSYDEQTLIPVTILMAMKCQSDTSGGDGTLVLEDGRPLHMVKIIGAVRGVDCQSTNVQYTIEDGTGCMDVKQWIDDNEPAGLMEMKKETTQEGIYVKVIGTIKEYGGSKMLVASSVRRLLSGNELTHHLLEVMYSAEKFKRADSIVPPVMHMQQNTTMGFNNPGPAATIGAGGGFGGGDSGGTNKDRVLELMQRLNSDTEEGTSVEQCIAELPNMSEPDIRQALNTLSEEGCLYSTINENCFKLAM
mmetsp:Transcript_36630/g.41206  ORF Transcript_36630/g.41206 Transcript_36630/m.41206 type:complete len:289 (-) Transcript_36630:1187-2053(-)